MRSPLSPVRWLSVVVLLLVALAPGRAETLTVATYNVRNYVAADRMTPGGWRQAWPKPEEEKRALRRVIRELNADVLFLQEMGPAQYLEELRRDLQLEGIAYQFAVVLDGPDPERHVAMLARRRPISLKHHGRIPFTIGGRTELVKRGMLEVTFSTAAGEVSVYALHLKSRLTEEPGDPGSAMRRAAEAAAVRDLIIMRHPLADVGRFLIVGDMNDGRDSRTLRLLSQRGSRVVAHIVPASDSRGEVWSYYFGAAETYSRVDHVLVSPQLLPAVSGGRGRIVDLPETLIASDHRPIVVTLDLAK